MSSSSDLESWSIPRLKRLLPLDDTSLGEIITYTATLSKPAAAEHLKNLLGDDGPALEFIASFNSRRKAGDGEPISRGGSSMTGSGSGGNDRRGGASGNGGNNDDDGHVPARKRGSGGAKKSKSNLHSAGPVRVPEGYGDVTGGYTKQYDGGREKAHEKFAMADTLHLPTVSNAGVTGSVGSSRDVSPAPGKNAGGAAKLPPSASGNLISDFGFANVRSKQAKKPQGHASHQQFHSSGSQPHSGTSTPQSGGKATTTTTTSSISDLTAAIAALELSTNPSLSTHRRKCTCNASIHPLFTTAPNCLNCGKIICALEGLQPCSFCDAPILTKTQVQDMIRALKDERGIEKMVAHNVGQQSQHSHSGRGTPTMTPFGGSGTPNDSGDEAIARATAHRDKLLAFQRENAQRTKIHDEAADYDTTLTAGATQWMTPLQRAAALKKQQKYLREMEEANKPEWEKKRTVLSVGIKNGKLVRTYEKAPREREKENEEMGGEGEGDIDDDAGGGVKQELSVGRTGKGAFSDNPLLASGKLIRPLWKAPEGESGGKGKGKDQDRERPSVWRRVQDDNEDNEQWILTGGLHGFGVEDRKMEDGS
ncbi:hypothetical protein PV10_06083 [Exophiala mesophila]|uniref:TRIP4/RQT4 C2HC5-type zinc finger domain-containing protein n=1 Tax=Exophiala mesophila TaxID=212818 RepID=A0A0D1WR33_EXOME|nr:uncharacterized protein PV10_06083 [Exophiala mesophila]KIV91555.1 hypothetical protein PV10_06083 [Exophiala mesophila]